MRWENAYRIVLTVVATWVVASPFIWRHNFESAFGSLPWDISSIPLALATLAAISFVPLWKMWTRWAITAIAFSASLGVAAFFGPVVFGDGTIFNAALLALVASVPAIMHSNSAFKQRRPKTHAP